MNRRNFVGGALAAGAIFALPKSKGDTGDDFLWFKKQNETHRYITFTREEMYGRSFRFRFIDDGDSIIIPSYPIVKPVTLPRSQQILLPSHSYTWDRLMDDTEACIKQHRREWPKSHIHVSICRMENTDVFGVLVTNQPTVPVRRKL